MKRYCLFIMLLSLVVGFAMGRVRAAPHIHWTGCAIANTQVSSVDCGWFETGRKLDGQRVRLRVTRLRRSPHPSNSSPVIYVPGGPGDPGGQNLHELAHWLDFQLHANGPDDLILFDPRGTGRSRPRFSCPEAATQQGVEALAECFHKLGKKTAARLGVAAQVADLHELIKTLGQGRVVLWAQSYGAVIARRLAASHPEDIRMMILDSPVLNPEPLPQRIRQAWARRKSQLTGSGRRSYQNLASVPSVPVTLATLTAVFDRNPRIITTAIVTPLVAHAIRLDGETLRAMVLVSSYRVERDMNVIHVLQSALRRPSVLARLSDPVTALVDRENTHAPVYWSTRCQLAPGKSPACRYWRMPKLTALSPAAQVPTLILTGTRDVLTPAPEAADFVLHHPGAQWLSVSGIGHGVLLRDACARHGVRRFIEKQGAWIGLLHCNH